jgi:hypothetical protein
MQPLQAFRNSLRNASPPDSTPDWTSFELTVEDGPSRHDAQMLTARTVPVDPYTAWLEKREAERSAAAPAWPARRFTRAPLSGSHPRTIRGTAAVGSRVRERV